MNVEQLRESIDVLEGSLKRAESALERHKEDEEISERMFSLKRTKNTYFEIVLAFEKGRQGDERLEYSEQLNRFDLLYGRLNHMLRRTSSNASQNDNHQIPNLLRDALNASPRQAQIMTLYNRLDSIGSDYRPRIWESPNTREYLPQDCALVESKWDYEFGNINLQEFKERWDCLLTAALQADLVSQWMVVKIFYYALNLIALLTVVLPVYSYCTSGNIGFFSIPKTEGESIIENVRSELHQLPELKPLMPG